MKNKTDYIENLGTLALASRLRRLLSRLTADGEQIYGALGIDFKIKWFPVLHLLVNNSGLTITQIADALCLTHPSIIEVTNDMTESKLIISQSCADDRRKRELRISKKGRQLYDRLQPVWAAFRQAGTEVNYELGNDFLKAVGKLEAAIERRSMYDRIISLLEKEKI